MVLNGEIGNWICGKRKPLLERLETRSAHKFSAESLGKHTTVLNDVVQRSGSGGREWPAVEFGWLAA